MYSCICRHGVNISFTIHKLKKYDAYRLSEYALKENLHYKGWIGKYGLNDLRLLANGRSDFQEQVQEALFSLWWGNIWIW